MGILSSSVSITQYHVEGKLQDPVIETIARGLKKQSIKDIDNESDEKTVGWTCFSDPFNADFEKTPFLIGTHLVFSLRIDKKTIPAKVVQKHYQLELKKRLETEVGTMRAQVEKLTRENMLYKDVADNRYIKWFLAGAGVLVFGFLIGYAVKRERRKSYLL